MDERALNSFLEAPVPALMVLSGPPWSGKTRLVAHWAAGVKESTGSPWSVGWVIPGHGMQAVGTALATGDRTVLLVDGFGPDAGQVMDALGGPDRVVRMVLVVDEHVDVAGLAKRHSPMAGHLAQSAKTWRVAQLEESSDHKRWFPRMVRDYAAAAGRPSAGLGVLPHVTVPLSTGMLNALALATAAQQRAFGLNPVLAELLQSLWEERCSQWHATAMEPRWGLAGVSETQISTAAAATLLGFEPSDQDAADRLATMPSWAGSSGDNRANSCGWLGEVVRRERDSTHPAIVLADVIDWPPRDREALVDSLISCGPATVDRLSRAVIDASPMVKGMGPILEQLIGGGLQALTHVVGLLRRGTVTSEVDAAVVQSVAGCVSTLEEVESIEAALPAGLGRVQVALQACRVRCHREGGDKPDLAASLHNLAVMLAELGRHREALTVAMEAVALRRRLADPDTGNPDAQAVGLAGSLTNLANILSELGRHREALTVAEEAVGLYRRLADPRAGNPDAGARHPDPA